MKTIRAEQMNVSVYLEAVSSRLLPNLIAWRLKVNLYDLSVRNATGSTPRTRTSKLRIPHSSLAEWEQLAATEIQQFFYTY